MSNLIVGNDGCSINDILKEVRKCESFTQLRDDWRQIAADLDLSTAQQNDIAASNPRAQPFELLQSILLKWRAKAADEATLGVLINTLKDLSYKEMATKLEVRFKVTNTNSAAGAAIGAVAVGASTSGSAAGSASNPDVPAKKKCIIENLQQLCELLYFNTDLSAQMLAKGILSRDDIEVLEDIGVRGKQNKKFFMFIHDKLLGQPGIYDEVIKALDSGAQGGVSHILKQVY